ncbi:hypothetical protein [Streptomyces sp. NPDC014894]|uniref:hypothetical protein n=1 Tax=unclassified Streptomyces TaxID=2593676 RepID=UPI0036F9AEC7
MARRLTRLAGECDDGECPAIYATDRGTLAVQGERMADHGLEIPSHETLVEIPIELMRKAVRGDLFQDFE